jgi:hypothetical protein
VRVLQREALITGDFANNLRLLQNYPPSDVQKLLDRWGSTEVAACGV